MVYLRFGGMSRELIGETARAILEELEELEGFSRSFGREAGTGAGAGGYAPGRNRDPGQSSGPGAGLGRATAGGRAKEIDSGAGSVSGGAAGRLAAALAAAVRGVRGVRGGGGSEEKDEPERAALAVTGALSALVRDEIEAAGFAQAQGAEGAELERRGEAGRGETRTGSAASGGAISLRREPGQRGFYALQGGEAAQAGAGLPGAGYGGGSAAMGPGELSEYFKRDSRRYDNGYERY